MSDMDISWVAFIVILMGGGSIFVHHIDLPTLEVGSDVTGNRKT